MAPVAVVLRPRLAAAVSNGTRRILGGLSHYLTTQMHFSPRTTSGGNSNMQQGD